MTLTDLQLRNVSQAPASQQSSLTALYESENSPSQGASTPSLYAPKSEPAVISTNTGQDALNGAISDHQTTVTNIQNQNTPAPTPTTTSTGTKSDADIKAIQAQGGITADEANSTGITTEMLTANYKYDTNTGYYIPKESTAGVTDASNTYEADRNKITSSFSNITGGWDTATKNLIDSLTKMYDDRIAREKDVNSHNEAAVNTENIRGGASRYAGGVARGILTAQEHAGLDRVAEIENEKAQAISTAQMNLQDKKYKSFIDEQDKLATLKKEQNDIIKDLRASAAAQQKAEAEKAQKLQDQLIEIGNKVLDRTGDSKLAKQIVDSGDIGKAMELAGDNIQTASGTPGEYLFYKREALAKGQVPMSYNDYANMDANRKRSIVNVGGSGLPSATLSKVTTTSDQFKTEPAVQNYQVIAQAVDVVKNSGKSPTDDIQRIYAFAKAMDPNSSVREGEYKTVQDYSQALLTRFGIKVKRVFDNSGFLTDDARKKIGDTLETRLKSYEGTYNSTRDSYSKKINKITGQTDGADYLIDYSIGGSTGADAIKAEEDAEKKLTTGLAGLKTSNPKLYTTVNNMYLSKDPSTGKPYTAQDILVAFPQIN